MTARAIVIGLVLGMFLTGLAWVNDLHLKQSPVASDMIPVSVYGLAFLGLLVLNPLLRLCRVKPLRTAEWGVVIAMLLVAVVVAGPALLYHFTPALTLPHALNQTEPSWDRLELLSYAPKPLLIDPGTPGQASFEQAVYGFRTGRAAPGAPIDISLVPWSAWTGTLMFWLPVLALLGIASICLMTVVHPQWAHRERLRYPIAEFAGTLLAGGDERTWPAIFYRRGFWAGFVPVCCIFLLNGTATWMGSSLQVPLVTDLTAALNRWPGLGPIPDLGGWLLQPRVVFVAIGFSYFINSDISLTLGLSPWLYGAVFLALYGMDINPRAGSYLGGAIEGYQRFGAYLGLALAFAYTGRRYYADVFRRMLGMQSRDRVPGHITWSARTAALSAVGVGLLLWRGAGLHPLLAGLFVLLLFLLFLVVARLCVETGLFSIHVWWHPVGILLGGFGFASLGPNALLAMAILCGVLTISPIVSMTAMSANALRIGEMAGVRIGRLTPWLLVASVVALLAGVGGTLVCQYSLGLGDPGWAADTASQAPYDVLAGELQSYTGSNEGWEAPRWNLIRPDREFLIAAAVGLLLVTAFSVLRLRFHWWLLHPILFLVWGTWPLAVLGFSFLLGWLCKVLFLRLGGREAYERAKPVFVGMVAGELFAGLLWALWGILYYAASGRIGPAFRTHI